MKLTKYSKPIKILSLSLLGTVLFFSMLLFINICTPSYGQKQQTPKPRNYFLQGSLDYWNIYYRTLEKTKQAIASSDMPTKQSLPLLDTISLLQNEIKYNVLYQDSVYSATEKIHKDTTKHK